MIARYIAVFLYAAMVITIGIKTSVTPNIILRVNGLEDELNAVKWKLLFIDDGNKFGKRPITPKKVAPIIVRADENHALK